MTTAVSELSLDMAIMDTGHWDRAYSGLRWTLAVPWTTGRVGGTRRGGGRQATPTIGWDWQRCRQWRVAMVNRLAKHSSMTDISMQDGPVDSASAMAPIATFIIVRGLYSTSLARCGSCTRALLMRDVQMRCSGGPGSKLGGPCCFICPSHRASPAATVGWGLYSLCQNTRQLCTQGWECQPRNMRLHCCSG